MIHLRNQFEQVLIRKGEQSETSIYGLQLRLPILLLDNPISFT